MEQFIMNNCKIANELRKYRDLTGCVNRVSLSDDPENYADYVITQELSYLDMVTANAVYSLWRSGEGKNGFRTIGEQHLIVIVGAGFVTVNAVCDKQTHIVAFAGHRSKSNPVNAGTAMAMRHRLAVLGPNCQIIFGRFTQPNSGHDPIACGTHVRTCNFFSVKNCNIKSVFDLTVESELF